MKITEFKPLSFVFSLQQQRWLPLGRIQSCLRCVGERCGPPVLVTFPSLSPGNIFALTLRDSASPRLPNVTRVAKLAMALVSAVPVPSPGLRGAAEVAAGTSPCHRRAEPSATSAASNSKLVLLTWALGAHDFCDILTSRSFSVI